jgi:hypothetical protein
MALQQARRGGCGHDIDWAITLGQDGQQRSGQDHVTQEGSLDDEGGRAVGRSGDRLRHLRRSESLTV